MGGALIESTHPKCISIQLSSLSDDGKQQTLYEWSHADKKISTCVKWHPRSCKIVTNVVDDKGKMSIINADSSALIYTCPIFSPETADNVCNLKKPQRNSSDILSKGDATEKSEESYCRQSFISSKHHSLRMSKDGSDSTVALGANLRDIVEEENVLDDQRHHLQPHYVPYIISGEGYEACTKSSVTYPQQPELKHNSSGNDRCSSSKSNNVCGLGFRNNRADVHGDCSSSGNIAEEQLDKFNSVKEMCIFFLKSHGLLGRLWANNTCASQEILDQEVQDSAKYSQLCKGCRHTGSPLKMLICDLCEEAFHISCCIPRIRKLPTDEWYCRSCSKRIRKTRFGAKPEGKPSGSSRRLLYCDQSPIQLMLTDRRPYTTSVRIGKDFQAEVPEWSGPAHSDYDASEEPSKLDPVEYTNHSDWCYGKRKKSSSIGNWVQCREVIFGNDDDEGTVCGKWRRAPLSVVQTDNWDCSCALPWDPVHADCAVPQELETEEVLRHLKYIEKLRPLRANNKQKTG